MKRFVPPRHPWLALSAGLAVLAGVASLGIGLRSVSTLSHEYAVADRPAEVARKLDQLLSAAQDLETGQRGYLLTGDDAFLAPYESARGRLAPILSRLDVLVSWNPVQVRRMPVLRQRLDAAEAYYAETVGVRRRGTARPGIGRAQAGEGKARMDSVRAIIADMEAEAERVHALRERHVRAAERSARQALWGSALGLLASLGLAGALGARAFRARDAATTALVASNDALSQALAEREAALHRVRTVQAQLVQQEKLAGLGRLTAGVAHELKNPLNFVINFAALVEEQADEAVRDAEADRVGVALDALPELRANARKVAEHADRADRIVQSMLTHARGVSGARHPVELRAVLAEATTHALGMVGGDDVRVVTEQPDEPVVVEGVPLALSRMFQNLIANAVYAVRERAGLGGDLPVPRYVPTVTLRTHLDDEHGVDVAVVEVEDNGAGIPEADVARIFEPFFTTKGPGQGTGLGLPLAHDIAVGHGGSLTARRAPGGGALFTVRIPLEPLADLEDEADDLAAASAPDDAEERRPAP